MNDQLENQLSKVIEEALKVAEKTGDFVIEQAPMLLQEFYRWQIVSAIIGIVFALGIYLLGRYLPMLWLSVEKPDKYSVNFFGKWGTGDGISKDPSASWIFFSITTIISIILVIKNIYKLMYILVAPKLYLIDYFL